MKLRITFKTPDAVDYAIQDYVVKDSDSDEELTDDEREIAEEETRTMEEDVRSFLGEYVRFGELITIEFDTDTKTATVIKS